MKRKPILFVAALTLSLSVLAGLTVSASAMQTDLHRATVTGRAAVTAQADAAVITFSVETQGETAEAAQAANTAILTAVKNTLRTGEALTECNVNQWCCPCPEEARADFQRTMELTTSAADAEGRAKELLACGVTGVYGTRYRLGDDSAARAEALRLAIANAEEKLKALGLADLNTVELREMPAMPPCDPYGECSPRIPVICEVSVTVAARQECR